MIISYSEADESLLMAFFKRLKVKVTKEVDPDDDEGVPLRVAHQIVEGLAWIEKREKGEVEGITWEQMMAELRANEKAVTT